MTFFFFFFCGQMGKLVLPSFPHQKAKGIFFHWILDVQLLDIPQTNLIYEIYYLFWKNTVFRQTAYKQPTAFSTLNFPLGTFNISSCIRAPTSTLMPSHMFIQAIINSEIVKKQNKKNPKWHLYWGTINENMCIKINTQFIQMLMIKKILNSDIKRETNVMMEWLMLFPIA